MSKLQIGEVRCLMEKALKLRNIHQSTATLMIEDYLGAQLEGHVTHGLGKFLLIDAALADREGQPEIVSEGPAFALVNGHRELGHACAAFSLDVLIPKAKKYGIAMVAGYNASRYGRLKVLGRVLAQNDLVGIVLNNAGPAAVTPFGGIDPILGTNPICFAFPCSPTPLLIDFSTSQKVWGEIRQAMLEGRSLPEESFLNKNGEITIDPDCAEAVLPFGGPKGYALCLGIELLAGAMISAKMGLNVDTQYDLGFLFIALNPTVFSPLDLFQVSVAKLLSEVKASRPNDPQSPVRVPGERSDTCRSIAEMEGYVVIDDQIIARLIQMSKSLGGGIGRDNKTD